MRKPTKQLPPKQNISQTGLMDIIDRRPDLKDSHKRLLFKILLLDRPGGGRGGRAGCFATDAALAEMLGWGERTVTRRLKELRDWGFIVQVSGSHNIRCRRVSIPSGIVRDLKSTVGGTDQPLVGGYNGIEKNLPSCCPSAGKQSFQSFPESEMQPISKVRPDNYERPARKYRGDPVKTMKNLPIGPLWDLFDPNELDSRTARRFMHFWNTNVINEDNLPDVVDHVVTHIDILPKEGDGRLGDIGTLDYFITTYPRRREAVAIERKEGLIDRARALGNLRLLEDVRSTGSHDHKGLKQLRNELLQLS